jgi:hypothetical protein
MATGKVEMAFPDTRPRGGNFVRPEAGQILDVSPPGFSWWRAAPHGEARYRLLVFSADSDTIYARSDLQDNNHVPDRVFPGGDYTWIVEAFDDKGNKKDAREFGSFRIQNNPAGNPWIPPSELLSKVPEGHPRLLFRRDHLEDIRSTLQSTRREAYTDLMKQADGYLGTEAPPEPDYDQIEDRPRRRLAYFESFQLMRRYHLGAMMHTALAYLMTGREEYGATAKEILLGATEWDPEGISSILAPYGDEVGLGLVKSEALTYDWIYDLLTEDERKRVEKMMVARADQMVRRLRKQKFLSNPQSSHNGRMPGYLVEHAMSLAEHPRAAEWLDFGLKAMLTTHPHWAGQDGGWAQGLAYGSAYNTMFITPLESLRLATGVNVWQRSFFDKSPYFYMYTMSPIGEIMGFGDSYNYPAARRAGQLRTLLQFHAERMQSPEVQWWINLLRDEEGQPAGIRAIPGMINPARTKPEKPSSFPNDAVFRGVGWAALHSDIASPEEDLMVVFKSSPYGGVSHSYNDQNSFQILCGGKVLARPGGLRWPHHGSPFHTRYSQQTMAQNAILVNGEGQLRGGAPHCGEIVDFESLQQVGYVCGEAAEAYGDLLNKWRRHVVLLRPSVICIIDDLEAPEPSTYQWLMHANQKLTLNQEAQAFRQKREGLVMNTEMFAADELKFSQSDEWPVDPRTGYPESLENVPEKLWHFKASSSVPSKRFRMATLMTVERSGQAVKATVTTPGKEIIKVMLQSGDTQTLVKVYLSLESDHILEVESISGDGKIQSFNKE